ncbi:uncharacterized protein LOC119657649 isoform X2 [Hermetia illucens]|uniref:uncharacterized protein LOC119657649 isoform X2 n=1 Tax=Hermetia illucens TaxID=343691 RepID=UPI0018CC6636|nr:uncharacterized protein LOC119657649 isoform X2 [Hermetia illucens]
MIRFVTAVAVFIALLAVAACSPADDNSTVTDNNATVANNTVTDNNATIANNTPAELSLDSALDSSEILLHSVKFKKTFGSKGCGKRYVDQRRVEHFSNGEESVYLTLHYPIEAKTIPPLTYAEVYCWQNSKCNHIEEIKFNREEIKIHVEAWRTKFLKCKLKVYTSCV